MKEPFLFAQCDDTVLFMHWTEGPLYWIISQMSQISKLVSNLWIHRELIVMMTWREVTGRYRGSFIGVFWSLIHPLFILGIYTLIFSTLFRPAWTQPAEETRATFTFLIFSGIMVHGWFAEVLHRSSSLIRENANYVKKVIFPLEILPLVAMGSATFHGLISLSVLLGGLLIYNGHLPWTLFWLPAVLLPFFLVTFGIALLISSLGVFFKDTTQIVQVASPLLLFLSPVFFTSSALPENVRLYFLLNPLTFIIDQVRAILISERLPDFSGWAFYSGVALIVFLAGATWFQKSRKAFADVL